MTTVHDLLQREARRLAAIADDQAERLAALEKRAETARELSIPGPAALDLRNARKMAHAAMQAAKAAARHARRGVAA